MGYVKSKDLKFINPYTFVPIQKNLSEKRKNLEEIQKEKLYTGKLKCRLRTITPLGIPDEKKKEGDEYPFFSYGEPDEPVLAIPGSSLRGAIRSVFEAATDSCFSTLREATGLSRRTDVRHAYKPGILVWEDGVWHLYRAERYLMTVDIDRSVKGKADRNYSENSFHLEKDAYISIITDRNGVRKAVTSENIELQFGDTVEFSLSGKKMHRKNGRPVWAGYARDIRLINGRKGNMPGKGRFLGIVYIGETFAEKKHGESIFVKKGEVKIDQKALEKAYEGLMETLDMYRDKAINKSKTHNGYQGFERAAQKKKIPVWYSQQDGKLSMASVGRTFFNSSLNELVDEHKPCTSRAGLCEACALFGMAQTDSLGSRIRITDAVIEDCYDKKKVCMKILGQPRNSYLPFYAREEGGNKEKKGAPMSYDHEGVQIAGRKFYWHNPAAATDSRIYEASGEKKQMNSTLELVMPKAEFSFDIYYDGVTEEQLKKLMWCIHFGENRIDGDLAHKLGRGKPLGLGSVKMVIEEQMERNFENGKYTWKTVKYPENDGSDLKLKNKDLLLKIANLHTLENGKNKNVPVRYPYVDVMQDVIVKDDKYIESYEWFDSYKNDSREKGRLPYITEEDQTLPVYLYDGK